MDFTSEQLAAIERRDGDLLLDASAGSGKTSVLVERFARAVCDDGIDVSAILAITFTDKAAAELRERIRARLRELGADEAARASEGAFISTIHGFCMRLLRASALAAGIDPRFAVLDRPEAERFADAAFEDALEDLAQNAEGGVKLIAAYGPGPLRGAVLGVYAELRSRGEVNPALPPLPPAPDAARARKDLERAAASAARELGTIANPAAKVAQALERLGRCADVVALAEPWPGELERLGLPGGNGAALGTEVCRAYVEALARFRRACEHRHAQRAHVLLDRLLRSFGEGYAQRKRDRSGLDFEDLELMTRGLLERSDELRERYRRRFSHVMVDELQDTNLVQLELIETVAEGNLFTVGDAQQSIYGFRHADVELFEQRGKRLAALGARAGLQTNFRSRPEILEKLNSAFSLALGDRFRPLVAGRAAAPVPEPRVELLIAEKDADWTSDGLASPWRLAEARALARRLGELRGSGVEPKEIVVLTRASTDLRAYERALEDASVPTYVIGGRGYWAHPQVLDMVAYLRALANPRDEEAFYTVLASPLVGTSLELLVVLAAAAATSDRDPWWVLREPEGRLDELAAADLARLAAFAEWFAAERRVAARSGVEELIERALERTGYDLKILALPGGERRLANVRKLMRLGREYETMHGLDLRGFLELVRGRAAGWAGAGDSREGEAPVEGEALNAVRLMTIHRAKGLEFPIVCVADLGRGPVNRPQLLRIGRDRRLGLRLAEPGTGKPEPALEYAALGEERQRLEAEEERRLFYVAMTRARERLILSGAAAAGDVGAGSTPMSWIGPAFIDAGVVPTWVSPEDLDQPGAQPPSNGQPPVAPAPAPPPVASAPKPPVAPAPAPGRPVTRLSYSSLGEYRRCGYRFYVERMLGLAAGPTRGIGDSEPGAQVAGLTGAERGILVHALLEKLDFRRPHVPSETTILAATSPAPSFEEAGQIASLIREFTASELCARLARAREIRREERFAFLLGEVLITGALDVLARESGGRMLVVDYKSDRLEGAEPGEVVTSAYATQRLVYALAALRAGAEQVEIAHVFLELSDQPVVASFTRPDLPGLEEELTALAGGVVQERFAVTEAPHRSLCNGCPAEGGLCSWPLEMTRREGTDRLF